MSWTWGPSNWLWQVRHTNPLEFLNAKYAVNWYAQQSAANWQSGTVGGKALAVVQDAVGGYIGAWTGQTASAAQAWWSLPISAATLFVGGQGAAVQGVKAIGTWQGVSRGLYTATDSLTGGTPLSPWSGGLQILGLGGGFVGQLAKRYPSSAQAYFWNASGQGEFNFSALPGIRTGQTLTDVSKVVGSFGFGTSVGDAINKSVGRHPSHLGAPEVGGILFENCDAELTDIGVIAGAYWDSKTSSLVLVGRHGDGATLDSMALPGMDRDHLAVALRASLAGQPIGVSIDPPSEYREGIKRGVNPPDGTAMLVSYLGGTDGTLFGAIMFEADRMLKCLDKGVHNETGEPVRASVPGFKPLLEMVHPRDGRPANVWHRFWFVIDKVELRHDTTSDAIAFGDVRLKVLTETEMDGQPKGQYVDPADGAFTRHLTERYDEYAKEFPILARLKELAKVAALAKFLVNRGISLDLGALFESPLRHVDTPSATPGISVTSPNVEIRQEGNVTHTSTVSLFGGVDMDADPHVLSDDGTARRLKNMAESKRPGRVRSWEIGNNGTTTKALAVRLGPLRSPSQRICDDHQFVRGKGSDLLRLRRVYDSNASLPGDFGPVWFLWVPFSLTVIPDSSQKRPEVLTQREARKSSATLDLVLHDHTSGRSSMYRETSRCDPKGQRVFYRVTAHTLSKGRSSYQCDPSDAIVAQTRGFLLSRGGREYCFDPSGHLSGIRENGREIVQYYRENRRIAQVRFDPGRVYDIRYDQAVPARIIEIAASDGRTLQYLYDQSGCLARCMEGDSDMESYAYDRQGRLVEVHDHSGRVISRNAYNDLGELVTSPSDTVTSPSGGKVSRTFEQNRLMSATDETGVTLRFQYGGKGEVSAVHVKGRHSRGWRLTYDSTGRLCSAQDPDGRTSLLSYDASGRRIQFTGRQGHSRSFHVDENGQLVAIVEPDGRRWSAEYDSIGSLRSVHGPTGERWEYSYAEQMLLGVRGPSGEVRVRPRRTSLAVQAIASNGMWRESVFDRAGCLTRYQASGVKPVRLQHDPQAHAFSVSSQAGTVRYEVDEDLLAVTVAFEDS